ncbi:MAG: fumarylacetoacetate hydrolase family protein, partial [Verrucomicrobiota bacterium]
MQRARILHNTTPHWGTVRDGAVELDCGDAVAIDQACWLAPAEPSKILAVHLTYQSRLTEYKAKTPPEPSYFMKPPTTLNGHLGEIRRPHGTRFLNYEGEIAVIVGREMKGVKPEQVHEYVAGFAPA